jgi:hypothetical protein
MRDARKRIIVLMKSRDNDVIFRHGVPVNNRQALYPLRVQPREISAIIETMFVREVTGVDPCAV